MLKLISIGAATVLLAACTANEESAPKIQIEAGESGTELKQEAQEALEQPEITEAQALLLSYKEAVEVRDLVVELTADMDNETKDALSEAIEAFSSDIEALKYYVDLADREPLLKGDHHEVLKLTADIEEAIALFAQVLEVLL